MDNKKLSSFFAPLFFLRHRRQALVAGVDAFILTPCAKNVSELNNDRIFALQGFVVGYKFTMMQNGGVQLHDFFVGEISESGFTGTIRQTYQTRDSKRWIMLL